MIGYVLFERSSVKKTGENNMKVEITHSLINSFQSKRGGFSKQSLSLLGIPWPPSKGWKDRIIGTTIEINENDMKRQEQRRQCSNPAKAVFHYGVLVPDTSSD